MFTFPTTLYRKSTVINTIQDVIPTAVLEIQAAKTASYPGTGQTWANMITTPYDGSTKTSNDFQLGDGSGAGTDDPVFSTDKFTLDGTQFVKIKTMSNFLKNLWRTDLTNKYWYACAFKVAGVSTGTQIITGTTNGGSSIGTRVEIRSNGQPRIANCNGTTTASTSFGSSETFVNGNTYLLVIAYDNAALTFKWALNSRTFSSPVSVNTSNTNTAQSNGVLCFGTGNRGSLKMKSGSELYGMAYGDGDLTNNQLSAIVSYFNSLPGGRTYA